MAQSSFFARTASIHNMKPGHEQTKFSSNLDPASKASAAMERLCKELLSSTMILATLSNMLLQALVEWS